MTLLLDIGMVRGVGVSTKAMFDHNGELVSTKQERQCLILAEEREFE